MAKYTKEEIAESVKALDAALALVRGHKRPQGNVQELYANVTHVAKSGMSRRIEFYVINISDRDAPFLQRITHHVARLAGLSYNEKGLRIDGCGMDMGFAAIDHALRSLERAKGLEYNSLGQISPSYL